MMAYPVSIFQMNNNYHMSQGGTGNPYFDWFGLVIALVLLLMVLHKIYTYSKELKSLREEEK